MRQNCSEVAKALWQAERTRVPISPISDDACWGMSEAYSIQQEFIKLKRGTGPIVGRKIGLTSKAMQSLLGVSQPDFGTLLASMDSSGQRSCSASRFIQPKIEPEISFRLGQDLRGPGVTVLDALAAIDLTYASLEIIDSRIKGWKIKIVDTIADNASSASFVISDQGHKVKDLDLVSVGVLFEKNGEIVSTGTGCAVMGHPAMPVAWLANTLAAFGQFLHAGEIIMSGAVVAAVDVAVGDHIRAFFGGLGEIAVTFTS